LCYGICFKKASRQLNECLAGVVVLMIKALVPYIYMRQSVTVSKVIEEPITIGKVLAGVLDLIPVFVQVLVVI